ncbi:hypothetical protein SAMN05216516_101276 [Izhakiella capsodis]|uniref:Uncharacterized protein n=1 Tax=Izhakiella capsodis TaxID=1367852 RepID=A0A1I4UQP4_9GAMM|nr:hypothetical protein SAMN05216516_101276 [Izhakiella capsodis]
MVYYIPLNAQSQCKTAISITPFMIMEQSHTSLPEERVALITATDFQLITERATCQTGDVRKR